MPAIGLGRISLNSQLYLFFFFFFGCTHTVCRILVPQQGMEPGPFAVRRQSPNHRTSREFPCSCFLMPELLVVSKPQEAQCPQRHPSNSRGRETRRGRITYLLKESSLGPPWQSSG